MAGLGLSTPILLLAVIYLIRLYLTGFHPQDVRQDMFLFWKQAIPLGFICGGVMFFATLSSKRGDFVDLLKLIVLLATPVVVVHFGLDSLPIESQLSIMLRTLSAFVILSVSYFSISITKKIFHNTSSNSP